MLHEKNSKLMQHALEASASQDTKGLVLRAERAEKEKDDMGKEVARLNEALGKAELGIPYVPPMPTAAMQSTREMQAKEAAEAEALTPRGSRSASKAPAPPRTPEMQQQMAQAQVDMHGVSYDDFVDLNTQLIEALAENEAKERELTEAENTMANNSKQMQTVLDRQALLYREHHKSNELWRDKVRSLNSQIKDLEQAHESSKLETRPVPAPRDPAPRGQLNASTPPGS